MRRSAGVNGVRGILPVLCDIVAGFTAFWRDRRAVNNKENQI